MLNNETIWDKLKKVHRNIYVMGFVSFAMQLGASLIYATAETLTQGFMTPSAILIMRSFSESTSTTIKVLSGVISDYLQNRKLMLTISYGSMIFVKIIFFICVFLSDNIMTPNSKFIIYITYIYITTHVIDRLMACLRDTPQAAMMLESIRESNLMYLNSGDNDKADENVIFSLGIRKAIGSLGSVIGGITAYFIVKFNLISGTYVYGIAIIPVIIGNIILFYGVKEIHNLNTNEDKNIINNEELNNNIYDLDNRYSYTSELKIKDISNMNTIDIIKMKIDDIAFWCNNNLNILSILYLSLASIISYYYGTIKTKIILFIIFHNILFIGDNIIFASLLRIGLLFGLMYGYGVWAFLGFVIGLYMKDIIQDLIKNFTHSSLFSLLPFLSIDTIYNIILPVFTLLLINNNYGYISIILIVIHNIINNLVPNFISSYTTIVLLILSQIKVYLMTEHVWTYILYTLISTIGVYSSYGSMFFIIPNQLINLLQYVGLATIPYKFLFYIMLIFKYHAHYIYTFIVYILSFIIPASMKLIPKIGNDISSIINISNNSFIGRIGNSFQIYELINLIYNNFRKFLSFIIVLAIIFIFIFTISISIVSKLILCLSLTVAISGILHFAYETDLMKKFFSHEEYLLPFGYTLLILCILHIGRCNDSMFFNHGTSGVSQIITKKEIPLIFTFLYVVITTSSILLSYLKKRKNLLFLIVAGSLIFANIFLLFHNIYGFALLLIFLGIYSSGSEVLFVSMIKDVIPNSESGTFLGVYYLCMSIATIINAILAVQTINRNNVLYIIKIYKYISPALYTKALLNPKIASSMVSLLFMIFPIISIIIWRIFAYYKKPKN